MRREYTLQHKEAIATHLTATDILLVIRVALFIAIVRLFIHPVRVFTAMAILFIFRVIGLVSYEICFGITGGKTALMASRRYKCILFYFAGAVLPLVLLSVFFR